MLRFVEREGQRRRSGDNSSTERREEEEEGEKKKTLPPEISTSRDQEAAKTFAQWWE